METHAVLPSPFLSGLVHFLTKCMLSFANFFNGSMICAFTSDMAGCYDSGRVALQQPVQ